MPEHTYGSHRQVTALEAGDIIYVGGQQRLSTLEVIAVRPETSAPGRLMIMDALAIEFHHQGDLYTGNEQVSFVLDVNSRVAVRAS